MRAIKYFLFAIVMMLFAIFGAILSWGGENILMTVIAIAAPIAAIIAVALGLLPPREKYDAYTPAEEKKDQPSQDDDTKTNQDAK